MRDHWIFYTKNRSEEWGFFHNYFGISWQCKIIYSSLIREKKSGSLFHSEIFKDIVAISFRFRVLRRFKVCSLLEKNISIFFHSDVYYFGMENKVGKQKKRNNLLASQNKVAPWHNNKVVLSSQMNGSPYYY